MFFSEGEFIQFFCDFRRKIAIAEAGNSGQTAEAKSMYIYLIFLGLRGVFRKQYGHVTYGL